MTESYSASGNWISLVVFTILFKLGAAPLHNWAPDLYNSLPTSIAAYMMILPK